VIFGIGHYPVAAEGAPRMDLFGDPLPSGALAQMGTIRYAHGGATMTTLTCAKKPRPIWRNRCLQLASC
jgi:hypothetical protein